MLRSEAGSLGLALGSRFLGAAAEGGDLHDLVYKPHYLPVPNAITLGVRASTYTFEGVETFNPHQMPFSVKFQIRFLPGVNSSRKRYGGLAND